MDARTISNNIKELHGNGALTDEEAEKLSILLAANANIAKLNWIVLQLSVLSEQLRAGQISDTVFADKKFEFFL